MSKHTKHPNIIFILADDMGYGDLGMFNNGLSQTPVLDEFARTGICLSQHYSAAPICSPARAALLTGRYPQRTGAIDTRELRPLSNLALREITIADRLRSAGYATGLVGKWHNGSLGEAYHPNARGFDEFVGFRGGGQDYWNWNLDRNGVLQSGNGRYLTDVLTDEAIAFLRRHRSHPFFLMLAYNAPHDPWQAPESDVRPFLETGRFTPEVSTIYGMIRRMDAGIGQVLAELQALGLQENTLVVFTSDNGPELDGACARFNCGYAGAKMYVYEGGIRVPCLLRWPAGLPGGGYSDDMTHFCDWVPTLLGVAGISVPAHPKLDGIDMLPALRGEKPGEGPRSRFWQFSRFQPLSFSNAAARHGDWKLVRPAIPLTLKVAAPDSALDADFRAHPYEQYEPYVERVPRRVLPEPPPPRLFNIAIDPGETVNLADQEPARVTKMIRDLENWFQSVEADRAAIEDEVYRQAYCPIYEHACVRIAAHSKRRET